MNHRFGFGVSSCRVAVLVVLVSVTAPAQTLYVDGRASGPGDGTSWANAFPELQSALAVAEAGDEIRVAQGIYHPDRGMGVTRGDRAATFALRSGVALRGGYAGLGAEEPDQRDVDVYASVLSGDLAGDDDPEFASIDENSHHVVVGRDVDASAVLDGFTVIGGNANGAYDQKRCFGGGVFLDRSDATLMGCVIAENAGNAGGGLYNLRGHPTLRDCTLRGNRALGNTSYTGSGGGICNVEGNPLLVRCRLIDNSAGDHGGGLFTGKGNPVVVSCVFEHNTSHFGGGGLAIALECQPQFVNCVIRGNTSHAGGAAVYNNEADPSFINCTILANRAEETGGGIMTYVGGRPTLVNCIVWDNRDLDGMGERTQLGASSRGSYLIRHCAVQGWTGELPGEATGGHDPLFVQRSRWDFRDTPYDPSDDLWISGDDRLLAGSPCADAGDNAALPHDVADLDGDGDTSEQIPYDGLGRARVLDDPAATDTGASVPPIVDLGATEGPDQGLVVGPGPGAIPEAGELEVAVSLARAPGVPLDVTVELLSDDADIALLSSSTLTFDDSNFGEAQNVIVGAAADSDNLRGAAIVRLRSPGLSAVDVMLFEDDDEPVPSVLHVDARATGDNTGASWGHAYRDLQDALAVARQASHVHEVRVAQGTYRPAPPGGLRTRSFLLASGLAVQGGYAGRSHPEPGRRDVREFSTILSGDLDLNDSDDEASRDDNSFHVVKAFGTDATAALDGCSLTGGHATGGSQDNRRGGGLFNSHGSGLTVTDCVFRDNHAEEKGGGLFSDADGLRLTRCSFLANSAFAGGGADTCEADLWGCLFANNTAVQGGGLHAPATPLSLVHCTVVDNTATGSVHYSGGGLCGDDDTEVELTGCILWGNRAPGGPNLSAQIDDDVYLRAGNVNTCCIQGWDHALGGAGNIDVDPQFVDAASSDFRLRVSSPCVDTGMAALPPELDVDLDGMPRLCGERADMGAYEFCDSIPTFVRGDANVDGETDLSDAVAVLGFLFRGTFQPPCFDAGDSDDSGDLDLTDAIYLLNHLFLGGPPLPEPVAACGADPTPDGLNCDDYVGCP